MESVADTFAPAQGTGSRDAENPLFVSAVKSNVRDGEAAAGATSLAKVLLITKHKTMPLHAGFRTTPNQPFSANMSE